MAHPHTLAVLDRRDPDDVLVRVATPSVNQWSAVAGLIGVAFLIFDRLFNLSAFITGRALNESNLRHDIQQCQRDITELNEIVKKVVDSASDRNNRLQEISGKLEIKMAELSRDVQALWRDIEHIRRRRPQQ